MASNATKDKKKGSEKICISGWIPEGRNVTHMLLRSDWVVRELALRVWLPQKTNAVHEFTEYISTLFRMKVTKIKIDLDLYNEKEVMELMDLYYDGDESREDFYLITRGKTSDDLIRTVVNRQTTKGVIILDIKPSPEFNLGSLVFKNALCLEISNCSWMKSLEQIYEAHGFIKIALKKTNFSSTDFQAVFEKWVDGWQPKWKSLDIDLKEEFDIQSYIDGRFMELNLANIVEIKLFEIPVMWTGPEDAMGYYITRFDGASARFTISNSTKTGSVVTYSAENKAEDFIFKRLFGS